MTEEILLEKAVENREMACQFFNSISELFKAGHTIRTAALAGMERATEAENLLREQIYGA